MQDSLRYSGKTDPLVSIIIPFLNASKYIGETIESVLKQTFTNWELILVDDGSTDSSADKVRSFISLYPERMSLYSHHDHANKGTSASRNLGLEHAKGEFIAFLDADDVWKPDFLMHHVKIFDRYQNISMSCGPCVMWFSWTGKKRDILRDNIQSQWVNRSTLINSLVLLEMSLRNNTDGIGGPLPAGILFRRSVLSMAGNWEEAFTGMLDDQVLRAKLWLLDLPVHITPECLSYYRRHDDSICAKTAKHGGYYEARKMYLEWLDSYLAEKGLVVGSLYKILQEESWCVRLGLVLERIPRVFDLFGWIRKTFRIFSTLTDIVRHNNLFFLFHPSVLMVIRRRVLRCLKQNLPGSITDSLLWLKSRGNF